ncbi:hypothetical protein [Alkalihalobacillus pseudalcaliphilus]|uniref:hypothetical protein n=1 Tax=Alkalihalobacillus pseudalcaliphilus TaxID=79884 RepID=UPI00064E0F7D|nr:hypothetical protein [Alkalihalobacillus pseudalcaliphilus]KMK75842.1 hypothetical protein AB990_11300 [Alkalihalobacillus pseudalcaliphilus]
MTNYYYLGSDKPLSIGNGTLDLVHVEPFHIKGMKYPIQVEIINGIEKDWELQALHQYLITHFQNNKESTVEVVHLLNSNRTDFHITERNNMEVQSLIDYQVLRLKEGHRLAIIKNK